MSTSAVQPAVSPAWKQEVNRRLAEHKGRKTTPPAKPRSSAETPCAASRRAQEAAARVAARYAKAPSYSEALAAEARAALRAAEAAQQAALEATAAVQTILADFESSVAGHPSAALHFAAPQRSEILERDPGAEDRLEIAAAPTLSPMAVEDNAAPQCVLAPPASTTEPVTVRWAPEFPARSIEPAEFHTGRGTQLFEEEWWKPASAEPQAPGVGEVEMVEPALPIAGNIIEFPRELVAPRKARPRLAEAPSAAAGAAAQLSIFEVDPAQLP
ncbi:MAG: hypothetical protein ACLGP3_07630, partial [Acidobacteriota bacterium]